MLRGEHLILTYQDGDSLVTAINNVSITVNEGQFIGLLGPSGSGKSSLLYLLSGLRKPTGGDVYLDGRAYSELSDTDMASLRRSEYGFVFQQHFLINYLTALENVLVSAPLQDNHSLTQASDLLARMGLGDKLHRFPYELSGGERQRVAVARAILHQPRIIFADEPTGLLDRATGLRIVSLLHDYCEQGSLITVTHDPEILNDADMVITLRDGHLTDLQDSKQHMKQEFML